MSCDPCGEVGTSTLRPPVYFSQLLKINLRFRQGILQVVESICGTMFIFWCGHCPNCRTVVSLGRSILPPEREPSKSGFRPVAKVVFFYCIAISNLSISGSWDSLGPFRPPAGLQIWFWVPVAKVVLFYYTPISNLSISGSWGSLGLFGPPDGPSCSVGRSVGVWWWRSA